MADDFILVPVADPMIGMVIKDSFVITQQLGRGGMGAVHLAQHLAAPHIRCVVKTILPHLSNNALMISRFNTETQAVARLAEHENIVELKDFGVLPSGQMFMQFEYIAGVPLDRFLAEWGGRLSLHRALYLALQVCDALDYAHAAGVVHRDLKPENLLVVIQDHNRVPRLLKIVDFGISKVAGAIVQTISGMKMGTPYYMSVEQYANAAEAGAKSDVFSLAVIVWQMITGELPWGRHPEPGVLYHLQRTVVPPPPPEDVMPAAVARILLRCFSVDPDDRPTMRQLALDLAAVVPATHDAPSGGAILLHIVRRFLMESPELARTMPRSAMANPDDVAAQLWPPAHTAASPPGVVPSAPVPPPAAPELDASGTAPASPHALGAPAAAAPLSPTPTTPVRSPGAAVSLPVAATPAGPGASLPVASPVAVHDVRGMSWPKIAEIPTGLISQRHVAQNPSTDVLAAMPRVRSIVAAAEIDLAGGTPGPEPYAHAEVPRVVVSNTQLSQGEPSSRATTPPNARTPQDMAHPEPPPVLLLPDVARAASRRKLLRILAAAVGLVLVTTTSFALVRRTGMASHGASQPDRASPGGSSDAGSGSASSAGSTTGGVIVDGGGVLTAAAATTAPLTVDASQLALGMDAAAASPSFAAPPDAAATGPEARLAAARAVDSDGADAAARPTGKPAANAALDASRVAGPRPAAQKKTLQARQLEARTTGARTGNLHLLVTPWAVCWVDGEKIDQTPCMLDGLPVGHYRVRLENSRVHKDETLTATVTAGETTTIERIW